MSSTILDLWISFLCHGIRGTARVPGGKNTFYCRSVASNSTSSHKRIAAHLILNTPLCLSAATTSRVSRYIITPWLMEPGGLKSHSQRLSNNAYPEPNQPNSLY